VELERAVSRTARSRALPELRGRSLRPAQRHPVEDSRDGGYDEAATRWSATTDKGETLQAQYLISCAGMLSEPLATQFAGQGGFKGRIFHTARWPREPVDFTAKRVGVIGTAATGIQVIQTIASQVGYLKVFQRTPQYAIPMNNPKLTDADRASYRKRFNELRHRVVRTFAGFDFDFMYGRWADLSPEERRADLEECGKKAR
jgi:acetone monooxygenase (methyl acetate-forming)